MSSKQPEPNGWTRAVSYVTDRLPGANQSSPFGALEIPLDHEDWQLELTPPGTLVCQSGYVLEDIQSLLSDGTAEDLGSDELAKQAKFFLQQTVSRHRPFLLQQGFHERFELAQDYVAVFFEHTVDIENHEELFRLIQRCRSALSRA